MRSLYLLKCIMQSEQQRQEYQKNLPLFLETLDALEHARLSSDNEIPRNSIISYCNRQVILIMKLVNAFSNTNRSDVVSGSSSDISRSTNDANSNERDVDAMSVSSWTLGSFYSGSSTFSTYFSSSKCTLVYSRSAFSRHLPSLITCVRKIANLTRRVAAREENYFCTYRYEIYNTEIRAVAKYVKTILECCRVDDQGNNSCNSIDVDPIVWTFSKESAPTSHTLSEMIQSTQNYPNELLSSTFGDVLTKLFWIKYFHHQTEVPWDTYVNSFVKEYGNHHEYAINAYRDKLARGASTSTPTVHIEDYIKFGIDESYRKLDAENESKLQEEISMYQAFQIACDPGSLVLLTGQLVDRNIVREAQPTLWTPTAMESLLGLKLRDISCGGQHAAVLGADGSLYTWGHGGFGRLGHGDCVYCPLPRRVLALTQVKIKQVSCGFAYSAAVTTEGVVYTWGAGDNGRLGLGDRYDRHTPVMVEKLDEKIVSVHGGSVHTAFLSERGAIFACGKWEYCGVGHEPDLYYPTLIKALDGIEIKQISMGPGGYHNIALSSKNDIYTWGHNRVGQLGLKNDSSVSKDSNGAYYIQLPTKLSKPFAPDQDEIISQVVAGWGHTGFLTDSGKAYMCGRNARGQLGLG